MDSQKKYFFRAADAETFLKDVKNVCQNNGIDPFEKDIVWRDETGTLRAGDGVFIAGASSWYKTPPQPEDTDPPSLSNTPEVGGHALINVIAKDEGLIDLVEAFAPSDPSKKPSEIADSEKIGSVTHRITEPATPVRVFL